MQDHTAQAVDPVCGMAVDTASAKTAAIGGRVWHFCSGACRDKFEANPQLYAGAWQYRRHQENHAMPHDRHQPALIPVFTSGFALSLFFSVSYILCILGYLSCPAYRCSIPPSPSFCRGSSC
jgi:YHS domain-containing protein